MDCVLAQKKERKEKGGLRRRMANVLVPSLGPSDPLLYHGEVLWRNRQPISDIRSASYGHTLGGGIGLTMLDSGSNDTPVNKKWIEEDDWELEIGNKFYPCKVQLAPFYDPKNFLVKA
jgi:4-methylaminobutanoate oxidase (formaldehyde-forming)